MSWMNISRKSSTVMKFMYQMNYLCRYEEIADIEPKWMSSAILYRKYCKWCRDNNAKEENVTVFGRILSEAGYRKKNPEWSGVWFVWNSLDGKTLL